MIELFVVPADIAGLMPSKCAPLCYVPGPRYQTPSLWRPGEPCTLLATEVRGSATWAVVAFGGEHVERHSLLALGLEIDDPIGRAIAQAWLWQRVADGQQHTPLYTVVPRAEIVELATYRAHASWWTPERIGRLREVVMRLAGRWADAAC